MTDGGKFLNMGLMGGFQVTGDVLLKEIACYLVLSLFLF
jgi:hypothetical protein